tara:strand:- start:823 stop:1032 length:210 start_codon:yes stop_codon:yes gene_type:complete
MISYKYLFNMKKNILFYLLLFSLLVNVFQYVNSKKIIDKYEQDIYKFKRKIEKFENNKEKMINPQNLDK